MKLTEMQIRRFWRQWSSIVRLHNWDRDEAESERHAVLRRAGFASLTEVDKLDGFDRVLAELAAIARPDDLAAQMRQAVMSQTRLHFAVGRLSSHLSPAATPLAYAAGIAADKFGTRDLGQLNDRQLTDLRNTLAARLCAHRRHQDMAA